MSFSHPINLLFADDHPIYRQGLIKTITSLPMINFCHEAENGLKAFEMCKAKHYHFVILDIEMPVMNGIEAAKLIKKSYPEIHIIIISHYDTKRFIIELIELGVKGYILKSTDGAEMLRALTLIMEGHNYFTPAVLHAWTDYVLDKSFKTKKSSVNALSKREIEIIKLFCMQKTAREIGDLLSISPETVNKHRSNIMKKIGVDNAVGLVIYAITHHIFIP